jgi:hypothetical protein
MDERKSGEGFDIVRLIINLAALGLMAGVVALVVAAVATGAV